MHSAQSRFPHLMHCSLSGKHVCLPHSAHVVSSSSHMVSPQISQWRAHFAHMNLPHSTQQSMWSAQYVPSQSSQRWWHPPHIAAPQSAHLYARSRAARRMQKFLPQLEHRGTCPPHTFLPQSSHVIIVSIVRSLVFHAFLDRTGRVGVGDTASTQAGPPCRIPCGIRLGGHTGPAWRARPERSVGRAPACVGAWRP